MKIPKSIPPNIQMILQFNLFFTTTQKLYQKFKSRKAGGKKLYCLHILLQEYNFPSLQLSYLILFVSIRQFLVSFLCYPHLLIILTHFLLLRQFFLQTLVIQIYISRIDLSISWIDLSISVPLSPYLRQISLPPFRPSPLLTTCLTNYRHNYIISLYIQLSFYICIYKCIFGGGAKGPRLPPFGAFCYGFHKKEFIFFIFAPLSIPPFEFLFTPHYH